ncbi:hypothetical protein EW15_0570 [Prochlorococcus sp. MIT 0801]|nr:hypothetical protein EW15_0570 [Prochlorococcus sp. MIT 0801]
MSIILKMPSSQLRINIVDLRKLSSYGFFQSISLLREILMK